MFANYHTHTARCRHAVGTEREYIARAIQSHIHILGFSDHTPFPDGPKSGMSPDELEDYTSTLLALREEYQGKLEIHIGLEAEFDPRTFPRLLDLLRQYPIEYLILGEHYTFGAPGDPGAQTPTDDEKLLDLHCGLCRDALDTGLFTYLAHPDVFYFTGSEAVYQEKMRQLCRFAYDRNIPLEINLLGLRTNRHYPSDRFWKIAGEEGCDVVIGTDAHEPEAFMDTNAPRTAMEMVDTYHLKLLQTVPLRPLK